MDGEISSTASVNVARTVEKTELLDNGDLKSRNHRGSQSAKLGDGVAECHAVQCGDLDSSS